MSNDSGIFKMETCEPRNLAIPSNVQFTCTSPRAPFTDVIGKPWAKDIVDLTSDELRGIHHRNLLEDPTIKEESSKIIKNIRLLLPDLTLSESIALSSTPLESLNLIQRLAITEATIRRLVNEKEETLFN